MKFVEMTIRRYIGFRKKFILDLGNNITEEKIDNMLEDFYEDERKYIEFHPVGGKSFCINKNNIFMLEYSIYEATFEIIGNK